MESNPELVSGSQSAGFPLSSVENISELKKGIGEAGSLEEREAKRRKFITALIARINDAIKRIKKEGPDKNLFIKTLTQARDGLEGMLDHTSEFEESESA